MAPRFSLDRYCHVASAVHACQWLTMREQFGLTANTLDAYARAIDSYLSLSRAATVPAKRALKQMLRAGSIN
jgi:hypothetical protein